MSKSWNVIEAFLGSRAKLLTFYFSKAGKKPPPPSQCWFSLSGTSRHQGDGGLAWCSGLPPVPKAGGPGAHVQRPGQRLFEPPALSATQFKAWFSGEAMALEEAHQVKPAF